ncbi:1-(5-phosphoribosyl)-5-[(5-phosphoribosylamino)methylideneamino] imidazole-4-carboxamide isomerase [Butyrivibrio proteoclasticus]|uniref:1-(5-phosphoribosyl)-5-[(5-phosphoribosylamino)methylideneamino] imidazole-4-carboxamide isomerase n=1 Tax=Butyrivibrio proteoclasticus TaxID=43305 RepID=A0A1I5T4F5_9FIRM|nr:phosphoribosylformimino-5-aminoimidazole carboxamide ribotide isomerase [Butyrivibrio proteoclasticus]SFP77893.1 1-(5-phosphoribosyl)-5-[(5-phosphoribosylamino)methylideneamino] imidazole-4-carboxamide isomerase [Butyrivibrio proteoclasticus]
MKLRPCIDIHNGKVKQIVGSSLVDDGDMARENYVSSKDAAFYSNMYRELGLSGGHVILLNAVDSPYYEMTKQQAIGALMANPGLLQVGGGITADNAQEFIEAGASHVIVTSYVFKNGKISYTNLKKLLKAVGKERIVLDLSCKAKNDKDVHVQGASYYIVTDRWQKMSDVRLCNETLEELSNYCDEFLVHAADVEGKQNGIEEKVVKVLADWGKIPITYAGGVGKISDIEKLKKLGKGKLDVTIGSALDIFGGHLVMNDVIAACD